MVEDRMVEEVLEWLAIVFFDCSFESSTSSSISASSSGLQASVFVIVLLCQSNGELVFRLSL